MFLPEVDSAGVLKGGDVLVYGMVPGLTFSRKCQPLAVVNVAGTEALLQGVFKTFLWFPSVMVAGGEFNIQGFLGQAIALPFWRCALPIVAVTSATWLLCW